MAEGRREPADRLTARPLHREVAYLPKNRPRHLKTRCQAPRSVDFTGVWTAWAFRPQTTPADGLACGERRKRKGDALSAGSLRPLTGPSVTARLQMPGSASLRPAALQLRFRLLNDEAAL
jgi:hypothetical protein